MTVRQLLETIDSAELAEWLAYDQIEPFGPQREDLRAGLICSTVANHSMSPPRRPRRPSDYMLFAHEPGQAFDAPVLLADPKSHSDLIRQAIFGVKPS
ncbi:MAG: hypothetical protein FGM40_08205 [Rhodocyclaceae bacterium]|nr:hypothetical protein [Rhodocyclaceae bacterium]